jgi:hypothetical protein
MKVTEIRIIAQKKGIKTGKMRKADLIRAIQSSEGNVTCFETAVNPVTGANPCDIIGCIWHSDCVIEE